MGLQREAFTSLQSVSHGLSQVEGWSSVRQCLNNYAPPFNLHLLGTPVGPLWLSQELADKQNCTQCLTKKEKKERKRNAKREQMSNESVVLKERNTKVWGPKESQEKWCGTIFRSSRLDPERGRTDPITPADILNVCTCGP